MVRSFGFACIIGLLTASLGARNAAAEIECGDGSDGAFAPTENIEIDLSKAVPGDWSQTPGDGNGVYDKEKWAIVFKYASIDIPEGVTVTFKNHPANPPVVWLSQGDVNIAGVVSLNGETSDPREKTPRFAVGGPGGFDGGRRGKAYLGIPGSAGLGPGGGSPPGGPGGGGGAGHAWRGADGYNYGAGGQAYGSVLVQPLMGGSGGGAGIADASRGDPEVSGGGGGGGAIVIASCSVVSIKGTGRIEANGGAAYSYNEHNSGSGGGGSAGGIRLIAPTIEGTGTLHAKGGAGGSGGGRSWGGPGAGGRIRLEADYLENFTGVTDPNWAHSFPVALFAPTTPSLWISKLNGISVTREPISGMRTVEVDIDNSKPITVEVLALNVKPGTQVTIHVIPAYFVRFSFTSTAGLTEKDGVLTVNIENVTIPAGRCEVQLQANWTP